MSDPKSFNIIKHKGQQNTTRNLKGRLVERADYVFMRLGDNVSYFPTAYDDIHFLYQNHLPYTEADVMIKFGGVLPQYLRGPLVLCTCGAEGVLMLEGPFEGLALCRMVAQVGKHQTSFQTKDGKLEFDKKTKEEFFMGDTDIEKTMRSQEEKEDTDSDAKRNHLNDDLEEN